MFIITSSPVIFPAGFIETLKRRLSVIEVPVGAIIPLLPEAQALTHYHALSAACQSFIDRMSGAAPVGTYSTIQEAFDAALNGDILELQALTSIETPNFNSGASITLPGNFDPAFATKTGYSTISGTLTISGGSVTVDKMAIR